MKSKLKNLLCISLVCIMILSTACGENEQKAVGNSITTPTATLKPSATSAPTNSNKNTPQNTTKPTAEPEIIPSDVKVGEHIKFGIFEQDGIVSNGKEEIEWRVLDVKNGNALLISKDALECISYHLNENCWQRNPDSTYKEPIHATHEKVTYETSSVRNWLTNDFYNGAFSKEEKDYILKTSLPSDQGTLSDCVFILNGDEATSYFDSAEDRLCEATQHAKDNGAYIQDNGKCYWWLRNQGATKDTADYIRATDGEVLDGTYACIKDNTVRPVIWIALTNSTNTTPSMDKPTTKPTATVAPKATPKPIDTNKYYENCGPILSNSKYTEFALKSTGEVYKVPAEMSTIDNWVIIMNDDKNNQFIIQVVHYEENDYFGTLVGIYAFVKGEFYKVSEGKVVSMSHETNKNIIRWVEDNGLGKSINVRSKWYNEVYIEVEGAFEVGAGEFVNSLGNAIVPKSENVKANVVKLS